MNFFTEQEVAEFIKQHPIKTNGAITEHKIEVELINDGDEWSKVTIPFWFQNPSVVGGVLLFLLDAHEAGAEVYLHENKAVVGFYHSAWNGAS